MKTLGERLDEDMYSSSSDEDSTQIPILKKSSLYTDQLPSEYLPTGNN